MGFCVWFTGLPGSGKTTLSSRIAALLRDQGLSVQILDGDIVRTRLSKELGFSREDREANIDRVAFVAGCIVRAGGIAVVSLVSPYREARDRARKEIGKFVEVYVSTPLEECIKRDPKGMYKKAQSGELKNFTGVSDPYEPPLAAELSIPTQQKSIEESAQRVIQTVRQLGYLGL